MKPKKKNKSSSKPSIIEYALTLVVAIGLILILILACIATVSVVNYRNNDADQMATILIINEAIAALEAQTATAAAMWEYELTSYATVYYPYTNLFDAQTATMAQIQHLIQATQTAAAR